MSTQAAATRTRVKTLEAELRELRREVQGLSHREARKVNIPGLRLAKTVADYEAYPPPPANTFEVEFQDGTYPEAVGWQTPVFTARGTVVHAHCVDDAYYREDEPVWIAERNRKYWIVFGRRIARHIQATIDAGFNTTNQQVVATVNEYFDGGPPANSLTLYNKPDGTAGNYQFEGVIGAIAYAEWDDQNGYYRIYQIDCPLLE